MHSVDKETWGHCGCSRVTGGGEGQGEVREAKLVHTGPEKFRLFQMWGGATGEL